MSHKARDRHVGLPARRAAAALVEAVLEKGEALDTALARDVARGPMCMLSGRDRALARAIVGAALRRKGQVDRVLAGFVERPLPESAGLARSVLRAATAEILFLAAPAHAVIDLAVEQIGMDRRVGRFKGLANAVLRRVAEGGAALIAGQDAARLATPDWLWERWTARYGPETARAIAEVHLREPPLDISVKSDPRGWAERLGGVVLRTGTVRLAPGAGRIEALEGFDEGAWWVQDAAAALPVHLLGDVAGKRVADLCAAPGGKTAELAAPHSREGGARVTAVDISANRLERLRANIDRLGLASMVEINEADAAEWMPDAEPFDAVLLDAPCTATGAIRRHPDIPHLKRPGDVAALAGVQARLLAHAAGLVRPGGRLVYCTCSLEPEECEVQIERFLDASNDFVLEPIAPSEIAGETDWIGPLGMLRTLPCHMAQGSEALSGMDGFFAARLLRKI